MSGEGRAGGVSHASGARLERCIDTHVQTMRCVIRKNAKRQLPGPQQRIPKAAKAGAGGQTKKNQVGGGRFYFLGVLDAPSRLARWCRCRSQSPARRVRHGVPIPTSTAAQNGCISRALQSAYSYQAEKGPLTSIRLNTRVLSDPASANERGEARARVGVVRGVFPRPERDVHRAALVHHVGLPPELHPQPHANLMPQAYAMDLKPRLAVHLSHLSVIG